MRPLLYQAELPRNNMGDRGPLGYGVDVSSTVSGTHETESKGQMRYGS